MGRDICFTTEQFYGCACGNLRAATRVVTRQYDEALRPTGLRISQLGPLVAISLFGPISITELAEKMFIDRTTLSRDLRLLQRRGYVRTRAGNDRRFREFSVTPKGQDSMAQALPLWQQAQARMRALLGNDNLKALLAQLSQVIVAASDKS
ncbi:MAG: MarR family transcriptional regulator [Chloroflexi bacterium]|nr:MarR family transcriptional regulator [Chloroflexota bacterium]MBI4288058.1 MarR family transcriptional regulator [Chloroflexota bacterium]